MKTFTATFQLDTDFESESEFKEWMETLLNQVAHNRDSRIVSVSELKEHAINITPNQWKIISEILHDTKTHVVYADQLFNAVFSRHGCYDDHTRNNFLCPLLDQLKKMGCAPIDIVVED